MRYIIIIMLWTFSLNSGADETVLERMDHFYAVSSEPEQLYNFFNETLRIPPVWSYQSYGNFSSGGLSFGNAVFEIVQFPDFKGASAFYGIAYLPRQHADESRKKLEQMGVELGESAPFSQSVDGVNQVLWENMTISRLSSPSMNVFICDYKNRISLNRGRHAVSQELENRAGGPLGIQELVSIQIGATDSTTKQQHWSLTLQDDSKDGNFSVGEGPQISVVQADADKILGVVLKVESLHKAKEWLKANNLLGEPSFKTIQIAASAVQGLVISLVE